MTNSILNHLKFGSTPWNYWRRENPDAVIVLDGADLNGMILTGVDFSHASLRGASMHATNLMNADLRYADLSGANLVEADLICAKLEGAVLTGANLHEADLLGAEMKQARYSAEDLKGALHAPSCAIRRAGLADIDAIADAHLDSIRSIGPCYYDAALVHDWGARVSGELYAAAMARGEVFFVAIREQGDTTAVLGFSSSHRIDDGEHGVGVYVRGTAARAGVGSALLRAAEGSAIAAGAASLHLDSSLAAVDFYKANGFEEAGRGEHRLSSGRMMACVFMRKTL
ncbi:MAG TPA: GNAT family N-acetyltransferase [Vicinamibacterales bacterium]|nr:GNAT family N-acetyltransferase [Vicinamibacterales bacterium]